MKGKLKNTKFYEEIVGSLQSARSQVVHTVIRTMVATNYEIGRLIIQKEQGVHDRAAYRKQLLKGFSRRLTSELGRGFSADNLKNRRRFFLVDEKSETLYRISDGALKDKKNREPSDLFRIKSEKSKIRSDFFKLGWSHYLFLMCIDNENKRQFYEIEAFRNIGAFANCRGSTILPSINT